jgi:hypothetical protein
MPPQRRWQRHILHDDTPLLYSSMSTRRSSFPSWILIRSSPMPHIIRRSDLSNEATRLLISSGRALQVPPQVNDIAESLSWLMTSDAPVPLRSCFRGISVGLGLVCDFESSAHIHPLDAHLKIAAIAMNNMMAEFCPTFHSEANGIIMLYMHSRWGNQLSFVGFKRLLLDCYLYVRSRYILSIG